MAKPLTTTQQALIQALILHSKVISEAAVQVGIETKLALAWMQTPYMRSAFEQAHKETVIRLIEEAQGEDFSDLDADVQAKAVARRGQWLNELDGYLHAPIEQMLVWR